MEATIRQGLSRITAGEATARVLGGFRRTDGRGVESHTTAQPRGRLDAVIASLLFMGGLRRSEVAALRWADVTDARAAGIEARLTAHSGRVVQAERPRRPEKVRTIIRRQEVMRPRGGSASPS